jgi:MATE family multidrug resistance protein
VAVNFYFTAQGALQGAAVLAANTLLLQLYLLFSYVVDGFAFAGEALSGRHMGAGNSTALRTTVRQLFAWGGALALLFSTAYALIGETLLGLLTDNDAVVGLASSFLPWVVAVPLCGVSAFLFDGIFVGLTATRGMLLSSFVAMLGFFGVWLLLRDSMGNHALWMAQLAFLALRGCVQAVIYPRLACVHR